MNEHVKLRRQGKFFNVYENDAYVLHAILGYKVSNGRVGFPVNTLAKVLSSLEDNKINYVVIERDVETSKNKFSKNNYEKYLKEGKKDSDTKREEENLINKIRNLNQDQIGKIVNYIKEVCNEE